MPTLVQTLLVTFVGLWGLTGTVLTAVAMYEIYSPAKQAARLAWRRQTLDRAHADQATDFFQTRRSFILVFVATMCLWPFFLHGVLKHEATRT